MSAPLALLLLATAAPEGETLLSGALVRVDSCFSGYASGVLADGRWVRPGEASDEAWDSPARLGNAGNTWVSAEQAGVEHWASLEWPSPRRVASVEVWWSLPEWRPRAARIELLAPDGTWRTAHEPAWFAASAESTRIVFPPAEVRAVRVLLHAWGGGSRALLAVQEILASDEPAGDSHGARWMSESEAARLAPRPLEPDVARLFLEQPGAGGPAVWMPDGSSVPVPELAGSAATAVSLPEGAGWVGVVAPIQHVLESFELRLARPHRGKAPGLEYTDGVAWREVERDVRAEVAEDGLSVRWQFRPLATSAIRVVLADGLEPRGVSAYRYLPPDPHTWPASLTEAGGIEREMLDSGHEPSFEALASQTLSMSPARALLGLKDSPLEVGAGWDGTLLGADTVCVRVGPERVGLAEVRDTVTRRHIDGWRPGVIVEGQVGDLRLRQTAFIAPDAGWSGEPALLVRVEVTNLGAAEADARLAVDATSVGRSAGRPEGHGLLGPSGPVLASSRPASAESDLDRYCVELRLARGESTEVDFALRLSEALPVTAEAGLAEGQFERALEGFRRYWDDLLRGTAELELPEERLVRCWKAVLCQILICGDGDIMPYGAAPSCYDGALFGLEEGYAMLALAYAGLGADAARYMDATYLTDEFVAKSPTYRGYEDRHQQYRNGLQPWYAVNLYRLTRDREWLRGHVPLLRACADWTVRERRSTMREEDGQRPLHWGLLPKWAYGGDIGDIECYALYGNYACAAGLESTAWALADLGDQASARAYSEEARAYRAVLDDVAARNLRRDRRPSFWPLRLYAEGIDEGEGEYYQLFAGALLDLTPFDPRGPRLGWVTDYLEAEDRIVCGLPRFRRDAGAGGIDGLYGIGYVLGKLQADRTDEFLLGLYGYLAWNMDRETFACRETNVLYASDLHVRSAYPTPDVSDPLPCGAAVASHYIRHMLATETPVAPGVEPTGLSLLQGAPRAWFADGERIAVEELPTAFGPVSFRVRSRADAGRIEARVEPPTRDRWESIRLRLRDPLGRPISRVTLNGAPHREWEAAGETIILRPGAVRYEVTVEYQGSPRRS